jgi:hypothetical protein
VTNAAGKGTNIKGCDPTTTIQEIKKQYEQKEGVSTSAQDLYTGDSEEELNDNSTLTDAGIAPGAQLWVVVDDNPFEQLYEEHFKPAIKAYEDYFAQEVDKYQNQALDAHLEEADKRKDKVPRDTPLMRSTLQELSYDLRSTYVGGSWINNGPRKEWYPSIDSRLATLHTTYQNQASLVRNAYTRTYSLLLNNWLQSFNKHQAEIATHLDNLLSAYVSFRSEHSDESKPSQPSKPCESVETFMEHAPIKEICEKMDQDIARLNADNGTHFQLSVSKPSFNSEVREVLS